MPRPPITSFQGENRFLSNFFIEPDGTHVEGEFQAEKCSMPQDFDRFRGLTPGQSKRLGRLIPLRGDWESVKLNTMYLLVRQKFADHPGLLSQLLGTGDAELIEGNTWGDTCWGICRGIGENHLGKILMEVREEFRNEIDEAAH